MRAVLKFFLFLFLIAAILFGGFEAYLRFSGVEEAEAKTVFELPIYESSLATSWYHASDLTYTDYFGEDLKINSLGFRDEDPDREKPIILMLGDDFTFGRDVAQSKIFSSILDENLDGFDLWNAGIIDYSALQYVAFLSENLVSSNTDLQPELVVINLFVGDDISELDEYDVLSETNELPDLVVHKRIFVDSEGFLRRINFDPEFSLAWQEIEKQFFGKIEQGLLSDWSVFLPVDHPDRDPDIDNRMRKVENYLVATNNLLENKGIDFLVVMMPLDAQVSRSYWPKYTNIPFDVSIMNMDLPQAKLKETFEEENIAYVDLLESFRADEMNGDLYQEGTIYLSEYGHSLVAEVLFGKVEEILSQ